MFADGTENNGHLCYRIYNLLRNNEGLTICQISKALNVTYYRVRHSLPVMESFGLFLSEDCDGRLYAFRVADGQRIQNGVR